MTNEEFTTIKNKYSPEFSTLGGFEHRVDGDSEVAIYSMARKYKPKSCLEIGPWEGGSTIAIMSALIKNRGDFLYVCSELDDERRRLTAEHTLEKCGMSPIMTGDITKNLDIVPETIDFLFHDTDHDRETTQWVLDNIFPRLTKGALVVFHDWAVEEKDGKWIGKGLDGVGGWPETQLLMDLHHAGKLPLKKLYWNYKNPDNWETGFFTKI